MSMAATVLVIGLMVAVVLVLVGGLVLMARGGAANRTYGNKMMVLRVTLQGLALLVVVVLMMAR